jgi:peptidoglycan/LPS O-acetylase OafA/YrhL
VVLYHIQGEVLNRSHPVVSVRYRILTRMLFSANHGVELFFVISGYILARPFAAQHLFGKTRPSLRKYFLRRVTRLEPPYIFNLLVSAAALIVLDHVAWRKVVPHMLANIVYLHRFFFPNPLLTVNSVTWSLEVEIQFYILAPLLCLLFTIRNSVLRRATFVGLMLAAAGWQQFFSLSTLTIAGQLQYFLAGLLLADLLMTTVSHISHHWRWDIASVAGWFSVFYFGAGNSNASTRYWLPFVVVFLYVAAFRGRVMYRFLRVRWVAYLGGMCYTIYLWHPLVLTGVQRGFNHISRWMPSDYGLLLLIHIVVKLIAIVVVCVPLYLLLERPCMDPEWPQKLRRYLLRARVGLSPTREEPKY